MAGKGKRFLIGCGIGCGLLIIVVVISIITFFAWVKRPGEVLGQDERFGPQSTAFVEWRLDLDDPGTSRVVEEILQGLQQANSRTVGDSPIGNVFSGFQNKQYTKKFANFFPALLTWVHDAGPEGEDLITISARGFGNQLRFMDWVFGRFMADDTDSVDLYRNETIYTVSDSGDLPFNAGFLRGATIFVSRDVAAARRTVDRLAVSHDKNAPNRIDEWLERVPESDRIRGAVLNVEGDLQRIWEKFVGPEKDLAWDRIQAIVIHGGFDAETNLTLQLDFVCTDSHCEGVDLSSLSGSLRISMDDPLIEIDTDDSGPEDARRVTLRISNAAGWVAKLFGGVQNEVSPASH